MTGRVVTVVVPGPVVVVVIVVPGPVVVVTVVVPGPVSYTLLRAHEP